LKLKVSVVYICLGIKQAVATTGANMPVSVDTAITSPMVLGECEEAVATTDDAIMPVSVDTAITSPMVLGECEEVASSSTSIPSGCYELAKYA